MPEELCAKLELSSKFVLLGFSKSQDCCGRRSKRCWNQGISPLPGIGVGMGVSVPRSSFLGLIPPGDPAPVLEPSTLS